MEPQYVQKVLSSRFFLTHFIVLFSGSIRVGKIVATAAANFLTPVTLELGGKCPIVVDPRDADFTVIARRILWGRTTNAGQVCNTFVLSRPQTTSLRFE